jgi:hypothetical protein
VQEAYREVVLDLNEEAVMVLQRTTAALFDGGDNMSTLLTAQEVNEWGSTLAQIAQCATQRQWPLPQLTGVLQCAIYLSLPTPLVSTRAWICHASPCFGVHELWC